MLFEGTKMLGALIMWFAGRDQHMQVHHRECCHKFNEQRSQEFIFCLAENHFHDESSLDCQWTLPATLN